MLNMPIEKLEAASQKFDTRNKEIKRIQDKKPNTIYNILLESLKNFR